MEFQLRRQELFAVQRSEAEKIRRLLELEQEQLQLTEFDASRTFSDRSPLVSLFTELTL